jgi:hypothetical protein
LKHRGGRRIVVVMRNVILAITILIPPIARADESASTDRLRMSLEVDPADYTVYGGYGGFIGIRPAATAPWRFRIGAGAATLPDAAVQNNDNNDGWHERIDAVVTVAAHRYFGHEDNGFFVGGMAGWSNITFTAPTGDKVGVSNVVVGFDAGYRWFPTKRLPGLVITPHLGAVIPVYKDKEPTVDAMTYKLLPVIPMPQLLVGYEFGVL